MLLSRRAVQLRPGALLEHAAILQEARCLFACFSARRALPAVQLGALSPGCNPGKDAAFLASLLPVVG